MATIGMEASTEHDDTNVPTERNNVPACDNNNNMTNLAPHTQTGTPLCGKSCYDHCPNDTRRIGTQPSGKYLSTRSHRHQRENMGNQPRADFCMHTLALPQSVLSTITALAAQGTFRLAHLIEKKNDGTQSCRERRAVQGKWGGGYYTLLVRDCPKSSLRDATCTPLCQHPHGTKHSAMHVPERPHGTSAPQPYSLG